MLLHLELTSKQDLVHIMASFDELDTDGTGTISTHQLRRQAREAHEAGPDGLEPEVDLSESLNGALRGLNLPLT